MPRKPKISPPRFQLVVASCQAEAERRSLLIRKRIEASASKRGRKFRIDRLNYGFFAADQFGLIPTQPDNTSRKPSRIRAAGRKLQDLLTPVSVTRDIDLREREAV